MMTFLFSKEVCPKTDPFEPLRDLLSSRVRKNDATWDQTGVPYRLLKLQSMPTSRAAALPAKNVAREQCDEMTDGVRTHSIAAEAANRFDHAVGFISVPRGEGSHRQAPILSPPIGSVNVF
jgi:hypothetical protein